MGTKLKKLTETEKHLVLFLMMDFGMVFLLCGKLIGKWAQEFCYQLWRAIMRGVGLGVAAVGVIFLAGAFLILTRRWRKNWMPELQEIDEKGETDEESSLKAAQLRFEEKAKIEAEQEKQLLEKTKRIPTEFLIVAGILLFYQWLDPMRFSYRRVLSWESVTDCIGEGILYFFLCGIFLACAWLLAERAQTKQLKETSFFVKEQKRYKSRTSFEKQLTLQIRKPFYIAVVFSIMMLVPVFMLFDGGWSEEALLLLILLLLLCILLDFAWSVYRNRLGKETGILLEQIHAMSEGSMESRKADIPENSLFCQTFEELENIESAMQKSVQKQMQAEHLKMDLITNVSHDLKTPLTSMIGYTDLLKKEELKPEARDYVEVIGTKQEQLKEMIQSLFELSKSTSGTEQFQMEELDMKRLLEQTLADMDDAISQSELSFRTALGEEPLLFLGDNGKMYRVVQNLVENILKYSLAGTRVYIDAGKEQGEIFVTLKNISAYEMNFEPEEMMERFVRGDKSRTSEGHGLGLAIASSYTSNMGGKMEIETDGDLFKVILHFPEITKPQAVSEK